MKGDLRLKREVAPTPTEKPSAQLPVAHLWVDASVYHLDTKFSYLVPENLNESAVVGALVSIPFHGREIFGLILSRSDDEGMQGLKSITKVIGTIPLLTPEIIDLITCASERYAAHPFDLIRSAVPDRIASVEKEFSSIFSTSRNIDADENRLFLQLPPVTSRSNLIASKVSNLADKAGVIAVLPDSREVQGLHLALLELGTPHVVLDSKLSKSEYFRNFLLLRTGQVSLAIGTRSAIFAPVANLGSIFVYNEGSEHFYEKRSPGWNVRDIAILRSRQERLSLYFAGYSPSSEVARFIDEDWFAFKKSKAKLRVSTFSPTHGELLPSRALAPIKKALEKGPVLFVVPLKGYAQAIRCAKCKTVSRCECGGAHEKISEKALIRCSHCLKSVQSWQCVWCHHHLPSLLSRGIDRHQHEIGILFPGVPIHSSTSDHFLSNATPTGIFLATPGMAPTSADGYSAVVILEGNRFLNQPDMRSDERVRELYFAHASLAKADSPIILIQDEGHSIATALSTWNPQMALRNELEERRSLGLPPYVRSALLTMENKEITKLQAALMSAKEEKRIPSSTKILGPITMGEKSALILTAEISDGDELVKTIHEFMRRRSAAKKPLPSLRIDPYSLSH